MARSGNQDATAQDLLERIDTCIQELQDRTDNWHGYPITRTPATRSAAMAGLVGLLEGGHLPLEELDIRCLTIFALCGVSIKKGTPAKDARLAYRGVGLLLLSLRDGSPGLLLDEAFPMLSKAIQASHDDAPTLVAAIDSLATATFAGARDAEEAGRSLKALWGVIFPPATRSKSAKSPAPKTSPVVVAAAVSAWTFLVSTVFSATNKQQKSDRAAWSAALASLAELLDADDRRVRMAAGEALAVCVELNLTQHATVRDMDALATKVSYLADEPPSKGANNAMLREQKDVFQQIAAFLDHDERPETSVRTSGERHDDMMKVSTWVRLVQLNFLEKFLGDGFFKHAQGNELFKDAFVFGRQEGKPLSIAKGKRKESLIVNPDWTWLCRNMLCLPRRQVWRCPQKLLQLGWH